MNDADDFAVVIHIIHSIEANRQHAIRFHYEPSSESEHVQINPWPILEES